MPCACAIPIIMGAAPLLYAATANVAAAMGFSLTNVLGKTLLDDLRRTKKQSEEISVVIPFEESNILETIPGEQKIMRFERKGISFTVSGDNRGKYSLTLKSTDKSKEELQKTGMKLRDRITQQFVYNKVVNELKGKGYVMVHEEMKENQMVHVVLRRFA